jgi:hypothetical protein
VEFIKSCINLKFTQSTSNSSIGRVFHLVVIDKGILLNKWKVIFIEILIEVNFSIKLDLGNLWKRRKIYRIQLSVKLEIKFVKVGMSKKLKV